MDSFVELGRVWQASMYEITLNLNVHCDNGGCSVEKCSKQRVFKLFNNLVLNETEDEVEAKVSNRSYIMPRKKIVMKHVPGSKPARCLEVFAREMAAGWTSWGNEPLHFPGLEILLETLVGCINRFWPQEYWLGPIFMVGSGDSEETFASSFEGANIRTRREA